VHPERTIARAGACSAFLAVVVSAFKHHLAQDRLKALRPRPRVACPLAAGAAKARPDVIALVRVEPLLHGPSCESQSPSPRRRLDGLKVQLVDRAPAYKRFDLGDDFDLEGLFEAPFLTASSEAEAVASLASHIPSLTSTSSLVSSVVLGATLFGPGPTPPAS
jgi:hypothetical protein